MSPLPDEDLASACQYELTLTDRQRAIRGVWVIFDRGRDILQIYGTRTSEPSLDVTTWHCCSRFTVERSRVRMAT